MPSERHLKIIILTDLIISKAPISTETLTIVNFQWDVMPDLFFYRDPADDEKEEKERAEADQQMMKTGDFAAPAKEEWGGEDRVDDWSADGQPAAPAPAAAAPVAPVAGYHVTEDWSAATETTDWAAASTEQTQNWGGSSQW